MREVLPVHESTWTMHLNTLDISMPTNKLHIKQCSVDNPTTTLWPLTRCGLMRSRSARSTLVRTKMVRLPWGSILLTMSVTLLRSASSEPSVGQRHDVIGTRSIERVKKRYLHIYNCVCATLWILSCVYTSTSVNIFLALLRQLWWCDRPWIHNMMAFGFSMCCLHSFWMLSRVLDAIPVVIVCQHTMYVYMYTQLYCKYVLDPSTQRQ